MTSAENAVLRPVAMNVLTSRAGHGTDVSTVAATASAAYEDLAAILVPLIGQMGLDAIIARALQLTQQEYPAVSAGDTDQHGAFAQVNVWLKQQDARIATDAAATMFSMVGGLLIAFIGEPLTMRLLRRAWPDGFTDVKIEEKLT